MDKHPVVICLTLCLIAGLVFSWPLAPNFFSSIPYTLRPIPGFERVPLMPGDHLQTYYWFWLLSDNLFGNSSLLTNPYEFNGPFGPMSAVYANFPFSLLYIILLPLGPKGAYNGLILLSFLLSGVAMYLLARTWTKDFWASLLAGLIFAVVPYRVSHITGGQLFGHVIFLLPLCLYFAELTLEKKRLIYGGAAGLCIVLMSLMEPHTSFLTALTVGIYLPSRILLFPPLPLVQEGGTKSLWPGFLGALMGGLSTSSFLWIRLGKKAGFPFWHLDLLQPLILGSIAVLLFWLYLSALFSSLTNLSFNEARHRIGKTFFLFLPLGLYALKYKLEIAHLGLVLPLICFSLFFTRLIILGIKQRNRLSWFDWYPILALTLGVGSGLTVAAAYLMHVRRTVFLPSLAGKGRMISEVLLFSPKAGNLFFWQDINKERFIQLGWGLLILAILGLIPLFKNKSKNQGYLALAGLTAFGALVLALGPTLTYFPLYQILFNYFPFFNYPRVPGRFVMVGVIFLCLLAGMSVAALRDWLSKKGWVRLRNGLPLLIIPLVLVEYHTWQPLGLSFMTKDNRIYNQIETGLAKGSRVLELPIWPGDSHQSSAYEYTVTRTRKPMINGYAPVVFRDYIQQVFWPLYPLDQGELGEAQREALKKLKVDLVTFHDNSMIYTEKVSPFPPRLALKRLITSPYLELLAQDQDISLFRLRNTPEPTITRSAFTSPVTEVFYVNNLPQETGKYQLDLSASGYYLLMDEKGLLQGKLIPRLGMRGNVICAVPGRDRPGFLTLGTNRFFPAGKYRARFRIKAGLTEGQQEIGRIEIIEDKTKTAVKKILRGGDFLHAENWEDIPLEFEIPQAKEIGFRIFFSGKTPLSFNLALIGFADQNTGTGAVEAEELLRQTGVVVSDSLASGKEAVFGKAGFHPPIYLCYGPYRTFKQGSYQAGFFIRLKDLPPIPKETDVVLLEVATDMGKRIFSQKWVKVQDLKTDHYVPVRLDFKVPFQCELGYRVKFSGKTDVLIDRMEVVESGVGLR